jgi:RNA polymerase sigma-70 factor (ECF subfamily)
MKELFDAGQSSAHIDDELICRYQSGEESALSEILSRHQKKVFGYINAAVRDRKVAEDIFQETFYKVIRTLKRNQYNSEGKFIQWLMRIAHNLIIDHFRKKGKMVTISKVTNADGKVTDIFEVINIEEESHETTMATQQVHLDIKKLVDHLPREQKEVVMLRHYEDMSFKEIADKTNVSINTSLGRMRYALINLRKLAEKHQVVLTV